MSNLMKELDRLIAKAGLRVTFDAARDVTKPCAICGTESEPRRLVSVGAYTHPALVRIRGPEIERPLCSKCEVLR